MGRGCGVCGGAAVWGGGVEWVGFGDRGEMQFAEFYTNPAASASDARS